MPADDLFVITAIVLVHTAADRIPETAQAIADLDGVSEVYSCAGDVDLIAVVKNSVSQVAAFLFPVLVLVSLLTATTRSEERRVGKECRL